MTFRKVQSSSHRDQAEEVISRSPNTQSGVTVNHRKKKKEKKRKYDSPRFVFRWNSFLK